MNCTEAIEQRELYREQLRKYREKKTELEERVSRALLAYHTATRRVGVAIGSNDLSRTFYARLDRAVRCQKLLHRAIRAEVLHAELNCPR